MHIYNMKWDETRDCISANFYPYPIFAFSRYLTSDIWYRLIPIDIRYIAQWNHMVGYQPIYRFWWTNILGKFWPIYQPRLSELLHRLQNPSSQHYEGWSQTSWWIHCWTGYGLTEEIRDWNNICSDKISMCTTCKRLINIRGRPELSTFSVMR